MRTRLLALAPSLLLPALLVTATACEEEVTDTGTWTPDTNDTIEECDSTEIYWDGPDAPQVGDTWTVLMRCDGAVLQGPMVLRIDPIDMARVFENEVEWTQTGTAELFVQVGSYRETMDVTVTQ